MLIYTAHCWASFAWWDYWWKN